LHWDERCRDICGIPQDRTLAPGMFLHMVHPDDQERVGAAMARAMRLPRSEFAEQFRMVTPDGRLIWIESTGSAIFEGDVCVRFVGVIRDITAEKNAELALVDKTASLQASLEQQVLERHLLWRNSQDLLAVIGPDGRVRDMTPSWQRLLGTSLDSVIGRPLAGFVHPDDLATAQTFLSPGSLGPRALEARLRHRDGTYRWFSWTALADVNGVLYANARSIQDEKDAAERVRLVEDALRQAHKMEAVGQLTGGIAHDFNNMLAGIIGSLDAIGRRLARGRYDDIERFMEAATTSAQRAAALTQRLLAFSRRQTLDVKSENAARVVEGMIELLHRTLGENIQLETRAAPDLWHCLTDANQLENAILNLAINARDAMPNGGRLVIDINNVSQTGQIDSLEASQYVAVNIADTGEGMNPQTVARAFDPFFTTKPIGQGTGLGLSMVYGFVNQVGGHVNISSEPGQGTSITLYFKRSEAEPETTSNGAAMPEFRADGSTVLVVEDDPSVRMLIAEALRDLGCHCIDAGDADAAMQIVSSDRRLDLIVSDVGLPGMNGRQLAGLARAVRPRIPILFVTGYADGVDNRSDMLGPGMDMLGKPFSNDQLAQRVAGLLTG
jgi:PAS domain S-box-containing protein